MTNPTTPPGHRIAGGAIVVHDGRILLVRYRSAEGGTYLVGPGGGALAHESVADAAVRETFEETGITVAPGHVVLIEDILTDRIKMCKVWLACTVIGGNATDTEGAREEGIIEARWYRRSELATETVYPSIVMARAWRSFYTSRYSAEVSPTRRTTL